jgi:Arc/MetJ-type ribon-helix-helix transcriptional regulator
MTVHLPQDLERFIKAEVHLGHFASEEDALVEAVRLLHRQRGQQGKQASTSAQTKTTPDPLLGVMRDAADELDEIVPEAMNHREQQPWRLSP